MKFGFRDLVLCQCGVWSADHDGRKTNGSTRRSRQNPDARGPRRSPSAASSRPSSSAVPRSATFARTSSSRSSTTASASPSPPASCSPSSASDQPDDRGRSDGPLKFVGRHQRQPAAALAPPADRYGEASSRQRPTVEIGVTASTEPSISSSPTPVFVDTTGAIRRPSMNRISTASLTGSMLVLTQSVPLDWRVSPRRTPATPQRSRK